MKRLPLLCADGRHVLSTIVASQLDVHARYGGVVPELASREHLRAITPVVREALLSARCRLSRISPPSRLPQAQASSVPCWLESLTLKPSALRATCPLSELTTSRVTSIRSCSSTAVSRSQPWRWSSAAAILISSK